VVIEHPEKLRSVPDERHGRRRAMSTPSLDWLAHHARTRPSKIAVVDLPSGRRLRYADVHERTERLATALATRFGVQAGDRVAVLSRNSGAMFEVQFACWRLGAVYVPLNWRLAVPELDYITRECTPRVLLHGAEFTPAAAALPAVPARVAWDVGEDGTDAYEHLLGDTPPSEFPRAAPTLDSLLMIMYTSGTTGRPKGVLITHGMTVWNVVNQTGFFRTSTDMVNLAILPLFTTGGLNCFANPAFHYGGTNVVMGPFDAAEALALLADPGLGVTHTQAVPSIWMLMSRRPEFTEATIPSLVGAGVGGSPAPEPLLRQWLDKGVALQQAFGMTETGSMVMALPREDALTKIGSCGLPFLHNEVRLVDTDGRDVARGEVGELWARGPNITPGYWNRPDITEATLTDGWLHTGDGLRQDSDGYFHVVDRLKDMYISGGENVYPAEVEAVLYQLDAIAEVAVVGVPDDRWQEVGRAFVVVKAGARLTADEVTAHCGANLARFKIPKSVVFLDELPHNATGKIVKSELRLVDGPRSS
jgi:fatty-acyl-CoA synthase